MSVTVGANDAGGIESVYDAETGKQQSAFSRSFRRETPFPGIPIAAGRD